MKYIDLRERTKEDILKIVMEKNIEIDRLNNIIKEVREYIDKAELGEDTEGDIVYLKDDLCGVELLEILDKGE